MGKTRSCPVRLELYQTAIQQLKVASDTIVGANINLKRYRDGVGNLGNLLDAQRDLQEVSKYQGQKYRQNADGIRLE